MTPDPLGQALHFLRMSGSFYCRSELTAPWGLTMPPMAGSMWFHVVVRGASLLTVPGAVPVRLGEGDFALVPHGIGHRLVDDAGTTDAPLVHDLPHDYVSDRYAVLRHGGDGAETTLVCGAVRFDHPVADQLVRSLPPLIELSTMPGAQAAWRRSTLMLIAEEARILDPGARQ